MAHLAQISATVVSAVAVFAVATPTVASGLSVGAVIKAGIESDSNPHRLSGDESDSYFVERVFVDLDVTSLTPNQAIVGVLRLGAKRFHEAGDEDALVLELSGHLRRRLAGGFGWLASLSARNRVERGHIRDYVRVAARTGPIVELGPVVFRTGPSVGYFLYRPDSDLSSFSRGAFAGVAWSIIREVQVGLSYAYAARDYRQARVIDDPTGLRLAEGQMREDDSHTVGASVSLQSVFVGALEFFWQRSVSNSFGKAYSRIIGRLSATVSLPLDLYLNAQLSAQRTVFEDDVLIDPTLTIDEDNRNSIIVALSGDIVEWLRWEVGYSVYLQAFGGDPLDYDRHLVFGGLVARFGD